MLTALMLLAALSGCQETAEDGSSAQNDTRSPEEYCEAYYSRAAPLREEFLRLSDTGDASLEGLFVALGAPGQLAVVFDGMVPHAPEEIRPETEAVRDSLRDLQSNLGDGVTDPAGAAGRNLLTAAAVAPSFQAVGAYLEKHCPLGSPIAARYGATPPPARTSTGAPSEPRTAVPDYQAPDAGTELVDVQGAGRFSVATSGHGFLVLRALVENATSENAQDMSTVTTYDAAGNHLATIGSPGAQTGDCGAADVWVDEGQQRIVLTKLLTRIPARGIEPESYAARLDAWDAETGEALWHLDVIPRSEYRLDCNIYSGADGVLDQFVATADGRYGVYLGGPTNDENAIVRSQVIDLGTGRVVRASDQELRVLGTYVASAGDGGYHDVPVDLFEPATFDVVGTLAPGIELNEPGEAAPEWVFEQGSSPNGVGLSSDAQRLYTPLEPPVSDLSNAERDLQWQVAAYDLPSGEVAWKSPPAAQRYPVAAAGDAVVAKQRFGEQELVGLSAATGEELWRLPAATICGLTASQLMLALNDQVAVVDLRTGEQLSYQDADGCPDIRRGGIMVTPGSLEPGQPSGITVTQALAP